MVVVFNLGLAGYVALKGNHPETISKEDGITFDISQEEYSILKREYFESEYKKYNNIIRKFAIQFKPRT